MQRGKAPFQSLSLFLPPWFVLLSNKLTASKVLHHRRLCYCSGPGSDESALLCPSNLVKAQLLSMNGMKEF